MKKMFCLCLLPICLSVAQGANSCPEQSKPTELCIDALLPVAPLPLTLNPAEKLTVKVINKTPWEKVTFDAKYEVIEDQSKKQLEALFRFIAKVTLAGVAPAGVLATDCPEPFKSALDVLAAEQSTVGASLKIRSAAAKTAGEAVKQILRETPETSSGFESKLDETIKLVASYPKPPIDLTSSAALLARIQALALTDAFFRLPPGEQQRINRILRAHLTEQATLENGAADVADAESGFLAAARLFAVVKKDKPNWFIVEQSFAQPNLRKASVEISLTDRSNPDSKPNKLATFTVTWQAESPLSMSLGLGISTLARRKFGVDALRAAQPLTTPNVFSYQIAEVVTRPVLLPLALVHYAIGKKSRRDWGFTFTTGAGVDLSGDSPTGEFVVGASVRYRSIYLTPLLHLGRRESLAPGYIIGEVAPEKFSPPTRSQWQRGFAFAITYKLPF